ncbi:MAG: SDR family NAD(P)-dependent oxidoreductase [Alphaproteobacteria bacterium]|nr:SDR family NAD(P)-dependent oxidoreductase [Alphaproteobacteria bacterium]
MSNSLQGMVAFITGGGTGMGLSHARVLATRGAKIAITDFKQENLDRAKIELQRDNLDVLCLKADNRVVAEVKAAVAAVENTFGKVDILINNAGISGMHAHIEEIDEAFFDSMFGTHVKGAFFATQAVVPGMKQRNFGRIINTGSSFAMIGSPAMSHYTMSKGALTALTRAWARELGSHGITVNTVSPGLVETPMTRGDLTPDMMQKIVSSMIIGRTVKPEEVSYLVAFIASREADAVTGQNFSPNGGQAIVGI